MLDYQGIVPYMHIFDNLQNKKNNDRTKYQIHITYMTYIFHPNSEKLLFWLLEKKNKLFCKIGKREFHFLGNFKIIYVFFLQKIQCFNFDNVVVQRLMNLTIPLVSFPLSNNIRIHLFLSPRNFRISLRSVFYLVNSTYHPLV